MCFQFLLLSTFVFVILQRNVSTSAWSYSMSKQTFLKEINYINDKNKKRTKEEEMEKEGRRSGEETQR